MPRLRPIEALVVLFAACGGTPARVEPIQNQAAPEHVTAAPQLAPPPSPPADPTAAALVTEDDIVAFTGYKGEFEVGPLDAEPQAGETSVHFRAVGEQEAFDVALRLWQFDGDAAAAKAHFDYLESVLSGATRTDEIATASLRASEGDIVGIAFLDEPRAVVVLLTCGNQQCTDDKKAMALVRRAYRRLR